ncbi:hypothetical protein [Kluyvera genomosp. 1]
MKHSKGYVFEAQND